MNRLPTNQKILVFSAHPDDDVISAGATLVQLVRNNNNIVSAYVTNSPKGVNRSLSDQEKIALRQQETQNACALIGLKPMFLSLDRPRLTINENSVGVVSELLQKEKPGIIFLPPPYDAHPTHAGVNQLVQQALGEAKIEQWFYETWTPIIKPSVIFFFGEELMRIKKQAIGQHRSQTERLNFINASIALNRFRGLMGQELLDGFGKKYHNKQTYGEAFYIQRYGEIHTRTI